MSTFRTRPRQHRRELSPAERARSLVAGAVGLRVGVLNLTHEVNRHGVGSDRIRGTLRLTGPLRPAIEPLPVGVSTHLVGPDPRDHEVAGPVLRLQPTRVSLSWHCERAQGADPDSVEIPLEEYRGSAPDPLLEYEAQWLPHLHLDHSELLRTLAAHAHGDLGDSTDVRPLGLDRFGLVLRLYDATCHRDHRLPFARPVTCGCEIRDAFNDLLRRAAPHAPGFSC